MALKSIDSSDQRSGEGKIDHSVTSHQNDVTMFTDVVSTATTGDFWHEIMEDYLKLAGTTRNVQKANNKSLNVHFV